MAGAARFEGRRVLITGGSSGIGRACVQAFADEGAHVVATGRDEARLRMTREACLEPVRVHTFVADLAEPHAAAEVVHHATATLGGLDILVNGAGLAITEPVLDVTDASWRTQTAVNLDAAFFASQEAARHMVERGDGCIVNVASIDALVPESPLAVYDTTKAALIALTKAMAHELGHRGVRVNAVAPGMTLTPMTEEDIADPEFRAAYLRTIPAQRFSRPEEQAGPILFLASEEASYVNGAVLVVDGGQTAGSWYYPWDVPPVAP